MGGEHRDETRQLCFCLMQALSQISAGCSSSPLFALSFTKQEQQIR